MPTPKDSQEQKADRLNTLKQERAALTVGSKGPAQEIVDAVSNAAQSIIANDPSSSSKSASKEQKSPEQSGENIEERIARLDSEISRLENDLGKNKELDDGALKSAIANLPKDPEELREILNGKGQFHPDPKMNDILKDTAQLMVDVAGKNPGGKLNVSCEITTHDGRQFAKIKVSCGNGKGNSKGSKLLDSLDSIESFFDSLSGKKVDKKDLPQKENNKDDEAKEESNSQEPVEIKAPNVPNLSRSESAGRS